MDIVRFTNIINRFKALRETPHTTTRLGNFLDLLSSLKELQDQKSKTRRRVDRQHLPNVTADLKGLREQVLPHRTARTLQHFEKHSDRLRISCFELMEHNFRENTHSNILRYLFDYRFYRHAPDLLSSFLHEYNTSIANLEAKLQEKTYSVIREKSVGNGRVDLFIEDRKQKFVVVVENKVLADVSVTEVDVDKQVTKTQLDTYKDFVEQYYKGYDALFLLLSLKPVLTEYPPYHIADYKKLHEVLQNNKTSDPILVEYLLLLQSLISDIYDKPRMVQIIRKLEEHQTSINLNDIELLNNALLL